MSHINDRGERVRVQRPVRNQIEIRMAALDQLIPSDHRARLVWLYVEALDLSLLYQPIRSVEGAAGRDAVDPRILLALWLQATLEGISSARQLDRLCQRDLVYQWICGGVGVNYDLLSQFRTRQGRFLEQLLIDTIATLLHQKLVTLDVVAQDGMRVRASAGSSSFRREKTLRKCHEEARRHVEALAQKSEDDSDETEGQSSSRRQSAQERAARERQQRVDQALQELARLQDLKESRKRGTGSTARCSTTDPEARLMKMGDGGFRPAYNVQFCSDGGSRLIVSVDVTNSGSDRCQLVPMHQRVGEHYGRVPGDYLVDGGFITHEAVTRVESQGTRVVGPIFGAGQLVKKGVDPSSRQRRDTDATFAFRQRMSTESGKELFRRRSSIAESPNATCRNRGLHQFRVRGLAKVRVMTLWQAVAHNFERLTSLKWLGRVLQPT